MATRGLCAGRRIEEEMTAMRLPWEVQIGLACIRSSSPSINCKASWCRTSIPLCSSSTAEASKWMGTMRKWEMCNKSKDTPLFNICAIHTHSTFFFHSFFLFQIGETCILITTFISSTNIFIYNHHRTCTRLNKIQLLIMYSYLCITTRMIERNL